jgi:hypothetical protein
VLALVLLLALLPARPAAAALVNLSPLFVGTVHAAGIDTGRVTDASSLTIAEVPIITGIGQDIRGIMEFDLSGLQIARIHQATLQFSEDLDQGGTGELHGYVGNGVLEFADATVSNLLASGYVNASHPWPSGPPYSDELIDVTPFLQDLILNGDQITGFMLQRRQPLATLGYAIAIDSLQLSLDFTPVPEPGSIALLLLGLGMTGTRFCKTLRRACSGDN